MKDGTSTSRDRGNEKPGDIYHGMDWDGKSEDLTIASLQETKAGWGGEEGDGSLRAMSRQKGTPDDQAVRCALGATNEPTLICLKRENLRKG